MICLVGYKSNIVLCLLCINSVHPHSNIMKQVAILFLKTSRYSQHCRVFAVLYPLALAQNQWSSWKRINNGAPGPLNIAPNNNNSNKTKLAAISANKVIDSGVHSQPSPSTAGRRTKSPQTCNPEKFGLGLRSKILQMDEENLHGYMCGSVPKYVYQSLLGKE